MKDTVEVIHFDIKVRDVPSFLFVQITFDKCTTNIYFENGKVGLKTTIANFQPLLAWNVSAYLRMFVFMKPRFQ